MTVETAAGHRLKQAVGVSTVIGTLMLPGVDNATIVQRMLTAINTFPTLFDGYFGLDYPMLPDRSFASTWGKPYRSIEITDRLTEAR